MKDKATSFKYIAMLFKWNSKFKYLYFILILMVIISSILGVCYSEGLKQLVNGANIKREQLLIRGAFILFSVFILQFVIQYFFIFVKQKLNNLTVLNLQEIVVNHILHSKIHSPQDLQTGDVAYRTLDLTESAQTTFNNKSFEFFNNILSVLFIAIYLSFINMELTLGSIVIGFVFPLFAKLIVSKQVRLSYDKKQEYDSRLVSFSQESFENTEIIQTHAMNTVLENKFNKILENRLKITKRILIFQSINARISTIVKIIGLLFIFGYGGLLAYNQSIDIGSLIVFSIAFLNTILPLANLSSIWFDLQKAISDLVRLESILNTSIKEDDEEAILANSDDEALDRIEFHNVSFQHHDIPILSGLNLIIDSGSFVALVGPSGSGKSTILKLLLRLYEPSNGEIHMNGKPLSKMSTQEIRKKAAYIPQNPELFSGTIKDNIRYGNLKASDDEIVEAAKLANIHDFIETLTGGYDSHVAEEGSTLSGGQKQRICIARAILSNSAVLLYDEPTSSLDPSNDEHIWRTILHLSQKKTSIIISHNISNLKHVDHIIYIDNGLIIEQGSHEDLLKLGGAYSSLYRLEIMNRKENGT
ncbi:Putative multidrug export ATP-binding/permease protein [Paenibacillus plantiphilus]|uniref:Multidrug export ATP-binding/permease protein n=1 Tax=Paenibacillus plantiphilus TaxID=2905650 RepID=A0ABN8GVB1_9BACL|nr:ABC transporter ATP-binding protein [Paenibacillus plantiphilus]CAH1219279.1 Putative multidrug export ATP-binding/permease protein [Paenibacillus plantiphilus]